MSISLPVLFCSILLASSSLALMFSGRQGLIVFILWAAAILLLLAGSAPRRLGVPRIFHRPDLLLVLLLASIYSLRFYILYQADILPFHGDEAILSRHAENAFQLGIMQGNWNLLGSQAGAISRFPALWYYLQGAVLHLLGPSVSTVKLLAFLTDIGISLLVFYLARTWFGRREALAATAVYASFPIVIHFGMTGMQNIQSTFFLFLGLCVLYRGLRGQEQARRFHLTLAGVICGLGMYFYLSSILNPFIMLAILGCYHLLGRHDQTARQRVMQPLRSSTHFLIGFLVSAGPFLLYSMTEFNFLAGRSGAYDFWLQQTNPLELLHTHTKAYLKGFYHEKMNGAGLFYVHFPAFAHALIAGLFVLGLAWAAIRFRRAEQGAPLIWIVLITTSIFGGIITEDPPAPQRLIHLFPLFGLGVVAGARQLGAAAERVVRQPAVNTALFWPLILACVCINLHAFFTENLPVYQEQSLSRGQQAFVEYYVYNDFSKDVVLHLPIHMRDQIYYYSRGRIDPLHVDNYSLHQVLARLSSSQEVVLLVTDFAGKEQLQSVGHLTWQQLERDCPNGYRVLIIYLQDIRPTPSAG